MKRLSLPDLSLEPLTVSHADEMFGILSDPELYRFLDRGPPSSVDELRTAFARWEQRASPDQRQRWLNWVVREPGGDCIGYVQATVIPPDAAWVAFVFARRVWGRGYARAAAAAMIDHLQQDHACARFLATTDARNRRSIALLRALSFVPATADESQAEPTAPGELLFVRGTPR